MSDEPTPARRASEVRDYLAALGAEIEQLAAEQRGQRVQLYGLIVMVGMVAGMLWAISKQIEQGP